MKSATGSVSMKVLDHPQLDDVRQFAAYVEKHVGNMEQAGWFVENNRLRGWIAELRKSSLEKEILATPAWTNF